MASDSTNSDRAPLNPNMVYRPITPSSLHDGAPEASRKFRFHGVACLRIVLVIFSLAAFILWISCGVIDGGLTVAALVGNLVVLVWNLLFLLPNACRVERNSTSFQCQIGIFQCACGSGDDDDDGAPKKPKNLVWIMDFAFAIALFVFCTVWWSSWPWHRSNWMRSKAISPLVFTYLVALVEIAVAFLCHFKMFRPMTVRFYYDEDNYPYDGIRLPRDMPARDSRHESASLLA